MSGIEIHGQEVSRPAQDVFNMKKRIKRQQDELDLKEKQISALKAMVADASKTILALEDKIKAAEERLLTRAARK